VVLLPPVALALLLTSDPAGTLRLRIPSWRYLALGTALALTLNPLVNELRTWVEWLLPTPEPIRKAMAELFGKMPDFGTALVLVALVPAICEEVAFRGFILSGLQSGRRTRSAVLLSALLFGFLHVILSLTQQFFNATLLGLVLGLLTIRSGSLLPAIAFHFLNNGMALVTGVLVSDPDLARVASALYRDRTEGLYHGHWVALGAIVSGVLLVAVARAKPRGSEPGEADSLREPVAGVGPSQGVR
jgi:sodium transport system permease protein